MTLKEAIVRWRHLKPEEIWALQDVSLHVDPGTSIGFVGRNGSGKTTLLRLIAGIFAPTTGSIVVGGSIGSLLELGAGFHPDFTGRENVYLSGSIYGLKRREVEGLFDEIVSFAELERFIDFPVRTYSSGMLMRLGFSIAAHVRADVLLLDEVFAVGDEAFQRKCVDRIMEFARQGGTLCFVSHAATAVEQLASGPCCWPRADRVRRRHRGGAAPLPRAPGRRGDARGGRRRACANRGPASCG